MRRAKTPIALTIDDTEPFAPSVAQPLRTRLRDLQQDTHFEPHRHDWAQLACCAGGLLQVVVRAAGPAGAEQDISVIVPPQRAVWIPPGALHSVMVVEAAQSRTVYLHASLVLPEWRQVRVLAVTPLLHALIDAQDQASYRHQPAEQAALTTLVRHELAQATCLPVGVPLPPAGRGDRRLRALCQGLLAQPDAFGTLAQWAAAHGASERTMARLFRAELGMSFHQWRQQAVLARALPRLAQGVPVAQVAADCGYASESAFSAMFKASMGASPRHFRPASGAVQGGTIAA
jgi:AraC-like DNA-binding protein